MNASMIPSGCVWLVGAGCGSADLITLRGQALLRSCQAVVYDDLIDRALLSFAPETAERIYVGKRRGAHSACQDDICRILIRLARQGKRVVRLKGGDPFVFGRGGEELQALQEAGIPCGEVPGISSAIAIPAAAGIPVTHRNLSRSVHIVTAHTSGSGLPDISRLALLEGTLVFLMGLGQLPAIARELIAAGKPPETPAAVISGGNAAHPAVVRGPLCQIPDLARAAGIQTPAVIVVGEAAALRLASAVSLPLQDLRVGLTGTPAFTEKLSARLLSYGAQPFLVQELEVRPLSVDLSGLSRPGTWAAFTSGNGVRCFFHALREQGQDVRSLAACRFAVVGAATEEALWSYGFRADLRPEPFTTAALGEALARSVRPGEPVLLFRSALASPALFGRLREAGLDAEDRRIYTVRPRGENGSARAAALQSASYLVFSSAGGVHAFWQEFGALPPQAVCVCIGPVTAAALRQHSAAPFLTASEISAEGILQAILRHHGAHAPQSGPHGTS